MRKRLGQVVAVLISLTVVGLLTSMLPEFVPDTFFIRPNSSGVGSTEQVTATLVDAQTATSVRVVEDGREDKTLSTEHAFVLVRIKLVAHGKTFNPVLTLQTKDGYTYTDLEQFGFPAPQQVFVGEFNITTYIFEVPRDKVAGCFIGVAGPPGIGVQPVRPVIRFDLPDLEVRDVDVVLPATEKGVVQ